MAAGIGQSTNALRPKPTSSPFFPGKPAEGQPKDNLSTNVSSHRNVSTARRFRRFIHSKVLADDWIPSSLPNPYLPVLDPTDDIAVEDPIALQCFVWMPPPEYFSRSNVEAFTPVVLLCQQPSDELEGALRTILTPQAYSKLELPPSRLFNEDRETIFPAIGDALRTCLLTAVTVPKCLLVGATSHPSIGYQTILDLVVVPILSFHAQISVKTIDILLPSLGAANGYVLSQTKRIAKAILGSSKMGHRVELATSASTALRVCRAVAWGASRHHNRDDSQWIELLEASLNGLDATHPRLK